MSNFRYSNMPPRQEPSDPLKRFFFFVELLLCMMALIAVPALADESAPHPAFIASPSVALRTSPAGNLAGTLLRNVPVQVTEQRGRWSHVIVDGWVPTADLRENPTASTARQSELAVSGFRLEPV